MFRCLVAPGTEPTPDARAQEAARLVSQFIGDMGVVAPASEDRRSFGPFAVKIDGVFVGGIARSPVDREIVLLGLAVGRRTIAELVPDQETLELLGEVGVDLVQGFHIGRPRPAEELR
jgi:EAL domain-containing protein (putative c-di-GMP-specific phosphodiesterase class I)